MSSLHDPVEWSVSRGLVEYPAAVAAMELRADAIAADTSRGAVWLVEHPPLYTAGTSARREDLLDPGRFPVFASGRGGQYTYHGPGQRVAYVMLNLKPRGADLAAYIRDLESWLIEALATIGVTARRRPGRVGLWIAGRDGREDKIAAIGVRVRRWVTFHGVSINVAPDLGHYSGIIPCGIRAHGVTSLRHLGLSIGMAEFDRALKAAFAATFGVSLMDARPLLGEDRGRDDQAVGA